MVELRCTVANLLAATTRMKMNRESRRISPYNVFSFLSERNGHLHTDALKVLFFSQQPEKENSSSGPTRPSWFIRSRPSMAVVMVPRGLPEDWRRRRASLHLQQIFRSGGDIDAFREGEGRPRPSVCEIFKHSRTVITCRPEDPE